MNNSEQRRMQLKSERKKREAKEISLIREKIRREKMKHEGHSDYYTVGGPINRAKHWYSK